VRLRLAGPPGNIDHMTEFGALVVYGADAAKTAAFYRAVGLDLADEDHGEGPVHYAADIGGVHFAIYPAHEPGRAPARRVAGASFPGFYVTSLDRVTAELAYLGAPVLQAHQQMPWGCRILAEDPDGRPVEVNQRGHCPGSLTAGP
jgi:lactoylglutathione lyase